MTVPADADAGGTGWDRSRWLGLLALGVAPWVLVVVGAELTLVFPFGLVDPQPLHVTSLADYLFRFTRGLPRFLLAWPAAVSLYLAGLASASLRFVDREDPRVSAALFGFAGASLLWVTLGFARRAGYVAVPLGTVLLWVAVWWLYAGRLGDALPGSHDREA